MTDLAPAALAAERLGILGGSFDPPHTGHVHAARAAARAFELGHVVFVPAARPPHKPGRVLAPAEDRLALSKLLVRGDDALSVWGGELRRAGPSYSVDTVRALLDRGARGLHWILGSDNLKGFSAWHEVETLLELAQPIVIYRSGDPQSLAAGACAGLSATARARLGRGFVAAPAVDASSSELRRLLAAGEEPGDALPAQLWEYIVRTGIYRAA